MEHLNAERLRKKGWSDREIAHAEGIFARAEAVKHPEMRFSEHVRLWTLFAIMLVGTVAASIALLPVLLFLHPLVSTLVVLVLGGVYGLLLTATLDTLALHHSHHHHGMSWLVIGAVVSLTVGFALIEKRYEGMTGAWYPHPLLLALVFTTAMLVPYLEHRRLHGSA